MSALSEDTGTRPYRHRFRLPGAFLRRLDFTGVRLVDADLRSADARNAIFVRANFRNADLTGTDLSGADLTGARNLTVDQLRAAIVDAETRLPETIDRAALVVPAKP